MTEYIVLCSNTIMVEADSKEEAEENAESDECAILDGMSFEAEKNDGEDD